MFRARSLAVVAAAVVAATTALLPASPAFAHTKLTGSTPAAKATVREPVTELTLKFSGLIKKAGSTVVVSGADKLSYSEGAATAVDRTITQAVRPLPVGVITVRWRTVSSDGHPIQGTYTFTNRAAPPAATSPSPSVTSAAPTPTPAAVEPTAASPVPVSRTASDDGSSPLGWIIAVVAAVIVFAGGLAWWRRRRTAA
ncbi:copper resistance protein CopC [Asanoa sp. WMMD1127]|uniref:copper resistance CopC family protein n=1 Tax=Asanoa sp. WMMD1127 TaxID=3016107 RepID=UPI002416B72B|nr:copper resistance protein CopC [Asanoa sp. WMMD1127]MDG4827465.1 copper resistance protein CopC [Asanoa sp. WMMD1127]